MEAKNSNNIRRFIIFQVFAILFLLLFFSVKAFSKNKAFVFKTDNVVTEHLQKITEVGYRSC